MTRVKICGITNSNDAHKAVRLGAWAVGFIFYKKSPRSVSPFKAREIIRELPPFVTPVGVFVNQKEGAVKQMADFCGINVLQFHGDETPTYCKRFKKCRVIKVFRVDGSFDLEKLKKYDNASAFLFDTHHPDAFGGTGKTFNWNIVKGAKNYGKPIILSGGLHYNNVREAIDSVNPYAVDTCSGVENSPGKKNERSMKLFIANVSC